MVECYLFSSFFSKLFGESIIFINSVIKEHRIEKNLILLQVLDFFRNFQTCVSDCYLNFSVDDIDEHSVHYLELFEFLQGDKKKSIVKRARCMFCYQTELWEQTCYKEAKCLAIQVSSHFIK